MNFYEYYMEDFDDYDLPYYHQGLLNVPISYDIIVVYDKQGNKVKVMNCEISGQVNQNESKPYTIFTKENGEDEDKQYYTVGLKDASGEVIIPAIYDGFDNAGAGERIDVQNGVVLVIWTELGENAFIGYGGSIDSLDSKRYYGYVDLKFSNEIKQSVKSQKEEP